MTDFYERMEGYVLPEHEARRRHVLAKTWTERGLKHDRLAERRALQLREQHPEQDARQRGQRRSRVAPADRQAGGSVFSVT